MEHCADKEKITTDPNPSARATAENGVLATFSSEVRNYTASSVLGELDAMDKELVKIKEQFLKLMTHALILEVDLATQFNPDLYNVQDALDEQCETCSKVSKDFVESPFGDQVMSQIDSVNEENINMYRHNIPEPSSEHAGKTDGAISEVYNDPEPNVDPALITELDLQNKTEDENNAVENVDFIDDNTKK